MSPGKPYLAEMPPAKVEPWTLELSAYGFGGTASGMLRSTSLDRSRYQIPGAMGCCTKPLARQFYDMIVFGAALRPD